MIKFTSTRHDGSHQDTISHNKKPGAALITLIQFDLGFGGRVTEITSTRIVVRTPVLGKIDVDVFEGTTAEMHYLVVATRFFYELRGIAPEDHAMQSMEVLRRESGGFRPFDVAMFGPLLSSSGFVKPALIGAVCSDRAVIEAALERSTDDVVDAIEMGIDTGEIEVALELLTT